MRITKEQFEQAIKDTSNFDNVALGVAHKFIFAYEDGMSAYQVDTEEFEWVEYRPWTGNYYGSK